MTNEQIIFNESMKLMEAGTIKTTGRCFEYEDENGDIHNVYEPETLHTFAAWKENGRQVKKGEHAKASFQIWKKGKKYTDKDGNEKDGKMFLTKAFFFTIDQTEPITAKS